jgi:hypothetical protein
MCPLSIPVKVLNGQALVECIAVGNVVTPGDQMRPSDPAACLGRLHLGNAPEVLEIELVGLARARVLR